MIDIIQMDESHFDQAAKLAADCFSLPWSKQAFAGEMRKGSVMLGAKSGGKLIGFIVMEIIVDEGYIHNVAVAAGSRLRGIGTQLVSAALKESDKLHLNRVILDVRTSNSGAISIYKSLGFKIVATRRNFYTCPVEDGYTMIKTG